MAFIAQRNPVPPPHFKIRAVPGLDRSDFGELHPPEPWPRNQRSMTEDERKALDACFWDEPKKKSGLDFSTALLIAATIVLLVSAALEFWPESNPEKPAIEQMDP